MVVACGDPLACCLPCLPARSRPPDPPARLPACLQVFPWLKVIISMREPIRWGDAWG